MIDLPLALPVRVLAHQYLAAIRNAAISTLRRSRHQNIAAALRT